MGERLKGKVAIITGATSGIGEETAQVFVEEGARVVIAGRSEERGRKIEERLGAAARFKYADVTKEEDIQEMIRFTYEEFGRIDCLFNNAGGRVEGTLETVTMENFLYGAKLLLGSVVFGMKHVAPIMKKQGSGCIINNSSVAAIRLNQGGYLYSALKAAVTHITRIAGVELGPYGIRVNSISPGAIATPIFLGGSQAADRLETTVQERKMEKLLANLSKATPLPRAGLPRDIAYAALYLASDEGSFVNCCDLVVDGGRTSLFRE
ncbi:MAG TPA: SDR family oxidoreductase [Syntrophales bacterium]|nr:SDR family oxidoreductase [Syntrophales bacterium]HOL59283.1 SDR family oxidoreductase [Syntrophales bacterium]HPO35333.1 SDR family oxidoreductase [Syntrophales bacterium]